MKKIFLALFTAFCAFNASATPVNVNTADAKTISDALSGIGLKKAEAIVKYREAKGEFKTVDDLVNVNGIGPKTVEKIRGDILLTDTATDAKAADKKTDAKAEPAPATDKKPDAKAEPAADKKPEAKADEKSDKAK